MALTAEEKLRLLYENDELPAAVQSELILHGILPETSSSSQKLNPSKPVISRPEKRSPPPPIERPQATDFDEHIDSGDEDDYVAACVAKFKTTNLQHNGASGGMEKKHSQPSAIPVDSNQGPGNMASKPEHPDNDNKSIPLHDQFGHPLLSQFCSLTLVTVFPYKFISNDSSDRIAKAFFDQGKIWRYGWDVHYIQNPCDINPKPIMLVPFHQFQELVDKINNRFKCKIVIPLDPNLGFTVPFYDDETPRPIYLGRGKDRDHILGMMEDIQDPDDGYGEAPEGATSQVDQSFAAFRKKMEYLAEAARRKNKAMKKRRTQDRVLQQQDWCRGLKRAQRYLGLRQRGVATNTLGQPDLGVEKMDKSEHEQKTALSGLQVDILDINDKVPYHFENDPIIISIDFESNERNHSQVTEIGVSTLDTMDLHDLPPGEGGCNWRVLIRSRHIRIAEYAGHVNDLFCPGDPNKFQFGISEFVPLAYAGCVFDECFQWPYSASFKNTKTLSSSQPSTIQYHQETGGTALDSEEIDHTSGESKESSKLSEYHTISTEMSSKSEINLEPNEDQTTKTSLKLDHLVQQKDLGRRNIVLVGHDIQGDISYMRLIKSSLLEPHEQTRSEESINSTILDCLDTAVMYRVLTRDIQSRSLGNILADIGITGWYLHNAGNDARYTLEAFIGIAIKGKLSDDKRKQSSMEETAALSKVWNDEINKRVKQKCQEAEEQILTEAAIWEAASGNETEMRQSTAVLQSMGLKERSENTSSTTQDSSNRLVSNDMSFSDASNQDGGDPLGWNSLLGNGSSKTNRSKKNAMAKKRETEEWYLKTATTENPP